MMKKHTEFFAEFNIIPAPVVKVDGICSETCRNCDNRDRNVGLVVHDECLVQREPSSEQDFFSCLCKALRANTSVPSLYPHANPQIDDHLFQILKLVQRHGYM